MRLRHPRSMLFVSGERPERFPKAMAAGADLVCIDLEDAVQPSLKAQVRQAVISFMAQPRSGDECGLAVRINGVATREGLGDILALAASGLRVDVLIAPKVEGPQELALLHGWLGEQFDALVAIVETPLGIERCAYLAQESRGRAPKLAALMLGGADLSLELGAQFGWDGLLSARGRLVNAARMAGLQCWDVPFLDLADATGLADETRRVAALGFGCKTAIHPSQIPVIHDALMPSRADLDWAKALLDALSNQSSATGAFLFKGKMVDAPVIAKARRIVQLGSGK